jgi:hypothetical protein
MDKERSEISLLIGYCSRQGGFPMKMADSSVAGGACQSPTTRWTLVTASVGDQNRTGRRLLPALRQTEIVNT